jgi:type VI secretion system VasD/TssJ family lipoprotein
LAVATRTEAWQDIRMRRPLWPTVALAVALGVPLGCAWFGGGKDEPSPVEVTIAAGQRLNPDERGEALPTMFRVYLLASAAKAEAASYEDLYRGVKEALGEDVIAGDELVLSPGETGTRKVVGEKPARALLVLGVFRRPSGTSWREIVPIERGRPRAVTFRAEDYRVERR